MAGAILYGGGAMLVLSVCVYIWVEGGRVPPWPPTPALVGWWVLGTLLALCMVMVVIAAASRGAGGA